MAKTITTEDNLTSIPLRKLFPTQWISSPSFSSSSSCLWGPGQLCELWRALWGWPHTRPSAAASKPDVCPSSDRSASCNPLHLQPRRNAHKKCFFLDICSEKQVHQFKWSLFVTWRPSLCISPSAFSFAPSLYAHSPSSALSQCWRGTWLQLWSTSASLRW